MTTIYLTDPQGIYLGPSLADPDPLDSGNWLVPRFAYMDAPPEVSDRQVAQRGADGWAVVPDWRGYKYWLPDGKCFVINEAGFEPPIDALTSEPAPVVHEPSPLEKISMIEAVSMIPRVVREFTITGLEREAAIDAVSPEQLYLTNPGYKRLKDLDDEIAALRDLL